MDRTKVQRVGWTCKRIQINSLQRKDEDTKDNGILPWTKQAQMANETSIWLQSRCLDKKNRSHQESGEPIEEPIHPGQQRRIQQGQEIFSEDYISSARVDQHTGCEYWLSSTSSSWWYASEKSKKWAHNFFFCSDLFFCYRARCGQNTHTQRIFLAHLHISSLRTCTCMAQGVARRVCIKHVHPHVITCLSVRCLFLLFCFLPLSLSRASTLLSHCLPVLCPAHQLPQCPDRNEEYCPMRTRKMQESCLVTDARAQVQLDNFDNSDTSTMIFQDESSDVDTEPSYSCDAELDDELITKALSSPLFIKEREEPANLRQACNTLMKKVCCQHSPFSHAQVRRDPYTNQVHICLKNGNQVATRILLERQKEQILAEVRSEIQTHELQAESDKRSIQELNGIIESQRREIDHTLAGDEQLRRDQLLLQVQPSEQNRGLREAHFKSLHEMEELKVQESRVDEFSRWRLIENQDTILELTARIQELQNEVNWLYEWLERF